MDRALAGNPAAAQELVDATGQTVLAFCRACLLDDARAEKLAGEAISDALSQLYDGRGTKGEAFLTMALKRAALLVRAGLVRKGKKSLPLPSAPRETAGGQQWSADGRDRSLLEQMLARMAPLERYLFALCHIAGFDENGIASVTGYGLETTRQALEAGRLRVACLLGKASETIGLPANMDHEVQRFIETSVFSGETAGALHETVLSHTAPVRKRRRMRVLVPLVAILVLGAIAGTLIAVHVARSRDDTADFDFSEPPAGEQQAEGELEDDDAATAGTTAETEAAIRADIEIEGYGTITVALDAEAAPETVSNFVALAESGFYDGLTFHRIIEGFMMQGGDPNGDGTGGSETAITGEFSDNGFDNPLSHTRGAISMARSSDYDSASSQFFIVQEDSTFLDGSYAAFGYVESGMDIVDAICEAAEPTDDNGTIAADAQPVITRITIRYAGDDGGQDDSVQQS